jgi:hypothetical protein
VFGVLGLGLLAGEVAETAGLAAPAAKEELWLSDFATARRVARLSGKPIFVVFR